MVFLQRRHILLKMVPLNKQSKKRQRAYHAAKRGDWNGVSPVTRVVPSKKVYDRRRAGRAARKEEN